ncbi:MAG: pilus assembly protein [Rhizobiales bacterium]|nr:pilus assembly protein [Hyphomicrobiales bacterium]
MFFSKIKFGLQSQRSIARSKRGVAAVEFALVAPIIVTLLLGSVDAVYALTAKRKVSVASSTMADLVAREVRITNDDIRGISDLGKLVMTPFDVNTARIVVTGFQVDASGRNAQVRWSDPIGPGAVAKSVGTTVALDTPLQPNVFLVLSEVELPYRTLLGFLERYLDLPNMFTLSDRRYFQSRSGLAIDRTSS